MKMQFVMKYAFLNFIFFSSDCGAILKVGQKMINTNLLPITLIVHVYSISIESDFVY